MAHRTARLLTEMAERRRRWIAIAIIGAMAALACTHSPAASERPENAALGDRYDAALAAYDARRFDDARREFEALAGEGVAQAEFMLGVMYEYGDGVEVSYSDAVRWYEEAAEQGLTSAETRLGILCIDGTGMPPDPRRARQWLERAAGKRDALALLTLGKLYATGQGVQQSPEDAYAYYLLAKAAGSPQAEEAIADLDSTLSPGRRAEASRRAAAIGATLPTFASTTASPGSDSATRARAPDVASIRFSPAMVKDDGLGGTAFHLLLPQGWTMKSGIAWRPDSASPADLELSATSRDANLTFRVLRRASYAWRSRGEEDSARPFVGPRGYEMQPPVGDAVVFIERVVLPEQYHGGAYQVLDRRPLPAVARVVANASANRNRVDVSAARVRIRIRTDSAAFDEDVYCVLVQSRTTSNGEEIVVWGAERLYAFRAPEGRLDEHQGILESVASSLRFDDAWLGRYGMLRQDLRDRPGRARIGEREFELFLASAKGSHANARSSEALEQERLRARVNAVLAAELGATENFFDPRSEREVSLPRGFARAWASSNGEYLVVGDGAYDPRESAPAEGWAELHAVSAR
jgi:hypothetical protein